VLSIGNFFSILPCSKSEEAEKILRRNIIFCITDELFTLHFPTVSVHLGGRIKFYNLPSCSVTIPTARVISSLKVRKKLISVPRIILIETQSPNNFFSIREIIIKDAPATIPPRQKTKTLPNIFPFNEITPLVQTHFSESSQRFLRSSHSVFSITKFYSEIFIFEIFFLFIDFFFPSCRAKLLF